jgi:hypothetical protein
MRQTRLVSSEAVSPIHVRLGELRFVHRCVLQVLGTIGPRLRSGELGHTIGGWPSGRMATVLKTASDCLGA